VSWHFTVAVIYLLLVITDVGDLLIYIWCFFPEEKTIQVFCPLFNFKLFYWVLLVHKIFCILPEGTWLSLLQRHLHTRVSCSTIHSSHIIGTAKMSHYQRMDLKNVVFIHNGISLSHEEEWNLSFTSKWMELENFILSEVSQAQKAKSGMFSLICGL
jgi:hypothetical protein